MQAGKVGKESELDSIAPKSVLKYLSCVESDLKKKSTPIIIIDRSSPTDFIFLLLYRKVIFFQFRRMEIVAQRVLQLKT